MTADDVPDWLLEMAKSTTVDSTWLEVLFAVALDAKDTGQAISTWIETGRKG